MSSPKDPPERLKIEGAEAPQVTDATGADARVRERQDTEKMPSIAPVVAETAASAPAPEISEISLKGMQVVRGYHLVEALLRERRSSLPSAVLQNMRRHGVAGRCVDAGVGTATGALLAFAVNPLLGIVAGTALLLARSVKDARRVRGRQVSRAHRSVIEARTMLARTVLSLPTQTVSVPVAELPDLAECRVLWIRSAWRLVRCVKGFNARLSAATRCLQGTERESDEDKAASQILMILRWIRPQLVRALRILEQTYRAEEPRTKGDLMALQGVNQHLADHDPFGDKRREVPNPDWLQLEREAIAQVDLPSLAAQDLVAFEASQEGGADPLEEKFRPHVETYGDEIDGLQRLKELEQTEREQQEEETRRQAADERWAKRSRDLDDE